jgi:hypothetical protein
MKTIRRALRSRFAPFTVMCSLGTTQSCWTLAEAMAWLPYCGPRAIITSRFYGGEAIVRRTIL